MAVEIAREENITPWEALLRGVRLSANRVAWVDSQLEQAVRFFDGNPHHPVIERWMKESREERKMLTAASKAAIDAGVAAAVVRQVELEGQIVASAITAALDKLNLTHEDRMAALEAAHDHLLGQPTIIDGDSGPGQIGQGPTHWS